MDSSLYNMLRKFNVKLEEKNAVHRKRMKLDSIQEEFSLEFDKEFYEMMSLLSFKNFSQDFVYVKDNEVFDFEILFDLDKDNELYNSLNRYTGRIPEGFVPFAATCFGDLFLIGNLQEPGIFYWQHENEYDGRLMSGEDLSNINKSTYRENVLKLSSSLTEFFMALEIEDTTSKHDSVVVMSADFSDDFLKLLNNRNISNVDD